MYECIIFINVIFLLMNEINTHTHSHTNTRIRAPTHTSTHTHSHTHSDSLSLTLRLTLTHMHAYTHACTRTHTHTHLLSHTHIKKDPYNTSAIMDMATPKITEAVERFLAHASYLSNFHPDCSPKSEQL